MLFRLLRASPRYPQLYPIFEQTKATGISAYWNAHGIPAPFNGVLPKGEIGLNLAWPASARVWTAETCQQGLLHPVEELALTLVPRLSDLRDTALGRTRFAEEMREQAARWCLEVAGGRACRPLADAAPLVVFNAVEADQLAPLPVSPFVLSRWSKAKVGPDMVAVERTSSWRPR